MKSFWLLPFVFSASLGMSFAQTNVALLHQLVEESKSEYNLQKGAKENQGRNSPLLSKRLELALRLSPWSTPLLIINSKSFSTVAKIRNWYFLR